MGVKEWPTRYAKLQARKAMQALPDRVRPFYHPEYRIGLYAGDPDGEFVGLVCDGCRQWREYMHKDTCPVRRYEDGYKWRPTLIKRFGRSRIQAAR